MNATSHTPPSQIKATEQAMAIMAVDSLRPSQECINLMHQIDRGEISHAQAVAAILQKAARYGNTPQ